MHLPKSDSVPTHFTSSIHVGMSAGPPNWRTILMAPLQPANLHTLSGYTHHIFSPHRISVLRTQHPCALAHRILHTLQPFHSHIVHTLQPGNLHTEFTLTIHPRHNTQFSLTICSNHECNYDFHYTCRITYTHHILLYTPIIPYTHLTTNYTHRTFSPQHSDHKHHVFQLHPPCTHTLCTHIQHFMHHTQRKHHATHYTQAYATLKSHNKLHRMFTPPRTLDELLHATHYALHISHHTHAPARNLGEHCHVLVVTVVADGTPNTLVLDFDTAALVRRFHAAVFILYIYVCIYRIYVHVHRYTYICI